MSKFLQQASFVAKILHICILLCISILVMDSFMQNLATLNFKTRLGWEICSSDINMRKGY